MAFDVKDFDNTGAGMGLAPKTATFRTTADNIAAVETAGYFDSQWASLKTGDVLYVQATDARKLYTLTVDAAAKTVVLFSVIAFAVIT